MVKKLKKFNNSFNLLFILLLLLILPACNDSNGPSVSKIEIMKDSIEIDEAEVIVGDVINLTAQTDSAVKLDLVWESSNKDVVSVINGKLEALDKGNVIITVYVKDFPYVSDSIYVSSSSKVEQLGVGSGLSANDPIFLGNEGDDEPLEIYFIEMQHIYADSIYIKKGNVDILIDSGYEYDGDFVEKVLSQYCADGRLDLLMFSHSDGDHINGAAKALRNIENVSLMIDYGGVGGGNVLNARNKYTAKGATYHSAIDCVNHANGASDLYYLTDDFYFEILDTGNYIKNNEGPNAGNGHSVAVIFYYKNFSFFTAGDLTASSEEDLLKNEDLPEVTLYKASHHGSHGSNTQDLLDTLNPKAVAISAAKAGQYQAEPGKPNKNNTYNLNGASGHPAEEALERIYKAPNISQNLNVYWNAVNGTMKFTTYGKNDFEFAGSPTMKGYYDLTLTNNVPVWNDELQDFENKVTGEENFKLHETKVFIFRGYIDILPEWARKEYFPEYGLN